MKWINFIERLVTWVLWPVFFPWNLFKDTVLILEDEKKNNVMIGHGWESPLWPVFGLSMGLVATHILENMPIAMYYFYSILGVYAVGFIFYVMFSSPSSDDRGHKTLCILNILVGILLGAFWYLVIVLYSPAKG